MKKMPIYRYLGRNGVLDILISLGDIPYVLRYRLVADEGKLLTDGIKKVNVIDVHEGDESKWTEINE